MALVEYNFDFSSEYHLNNIIIIIWVIIYRIIQLLTIGRYVQFLPH